MDRYGYKSQNALLNGQELVFLLDLMVDHQTEFGGSPEDKKRVYHCINRSINNIPPERGQLKQDQTGSVCKRMWENYSADNRGSRERFIDLGKDYIRRPLGSCRDRSPLPWKLSERPLPSATREHDEYCPVKISARAAAAREAATEASAAPVTGAEAAAADTIGSLMISTALSTDRRRLENNELYLSDLEIPGRLRQLEGKIWVSAKTYISCRIRRNDSESVHSLIAIVLENEPALDASHDLLNKAWVASIVSRVVFTEILSLEHPLRHPHKDNLRVALDLIGQSISNVPASRAYLLLAQGEKRDVAFQLVSQAGVKAALFQLSHKIQANLEPLFALNLAPATMFSDTHCLPFVDALFEAMCLRVDLTFKDSILKTSWPRREETFDTEVMTADNHISPDNP